MRRETEAHTKINGSAKLIWKLLPSAPQEEGASQGRGAAKPSVHQDPTGHRTMVVVFGQYQPLKQGASTRRSAGGGGIAAPSAAFAFIMAVHDASSAACCGCPR
jgi:hypothetical protein